MLVRSREYITDALTLLYSAQTSEEQIASSTLINNGIGFNSADSAFCSSLARQVIAGKSLTVPQLRVAYKKLAKYTSQLSSLDESKYIDDPSWLEEPTPEFLGTIRYDAERHLMILSPNVKPSKFFMEFGYTWSPEWEAWTAAPTEQSVNGLRAKYKVRGVGPKPVFDSQGKTRTWEKKPGWVELVKDKFIFHPMIDKVSALKTEGWSLDKRTKLWSIYASIDALYYLEVVVGDTPGYHPSVEKWLEKLREVPEYTYDFQSTKGDEPLGFQKADADFLLRYERVLLSLNPGLGKTIVSIIANRVGTAKRILVISPLSLLRNWQTEISAWDPGALSFICHKEVKNYEPSISIGRLYWIVNYETAVKFHEKLPSFKFDTIIIDETIKLKNRKTVRYGSLSKLVEESNPQRVWLLSGNPSSRMYDDLWAQLHLLDRRRFPSYWRFAERYCYLEKNPWGTKVVANKPDAAFRLRRDLPDIFVSQTQEQVTDIPDFVHIEILVPMEEKQQRFYKAIEDEMLLMSADLDPDTALHLSTVLAQITRSIQAASNPLLCGGPDIAAKWDALIDQLEIQEGPHIVWTAYKMTAAILKDRLSAMRYKVAALTGDTPAAERQIIVDNFQAGKYDVLIAHPAVGKYGFTLTAARTSHYLERSYNGDDFFQSLYRIKRIGTIYPPVIVRYLAETRDGFPTIDAVIDSVLDYKTQAVHKLTAGDLSILRRIKWQ